eukprot:TRINITY_DN34509_c0_g1_i1.p1 TRINITY_DN34509_c0_g1~~TRINITY_DN34509_c0_g1_i1.p1  ORF type:complete len:356 (+),score=57.16 TRINITY_DN34509_c0_g1_i1:76-1143(+)
MSHTLDSSPLRNQHEPQPIPPPKANPPIPLSPTKGILVPECHPCGCPSLKRPCRHNDWDDVRTRKGHKILRCRICHRKWKLLSGTLTRCAKFIQDEVCENGLQCSLLHVHKKKSGSKENCDVDVAAIISACVEAGHGIVAETPPASPGSMLCRFRNAQTCVPCSPMNMGTKQSLSSLLSTLANTLGEGCELTCDVNITMPTNSESMDDDNINTQKEEENGLSDAQDEPISPPPQARKEVTSPPTTSIAMRRSFAKPEVAIPTKAGIQSVKVSITPKGIIFTSPTAGPSGKLVTGKMSIDELNQLVHGRRKSLDSPASDINVKVTNAHISSPNGDYIPSPCSVSSSPNGLTPEVRC